MGSDESHFNVPVGSDGQSHKTVSTNHNLFGDSVAGGGGVYLLVIHYPRYPLFFFPLARVCVCMRERERVSVCQNTRVCFVVVVVVCVYSGGGVAAHFVTGAHKFDALPARFFHSGTFCHYVMTERAQRSTRCTFCHSFASNTIICL